MSGLPYIRSRLDSLHQVDTKLVSSLDSLSSIMTTLRKGKIEGNTEELEQDFKEQIDQFYLNLSDAAINLRKEIKCLDDKISNSSQETDAETEKLSILPININKKAVWTGDYKLRQEVKALNGILDQADEKTSGDQDIEMS